jgi:iron complex transport system substrate-binding protein/vitamin B12 transport system substrate-binding protein
MLAWFSLRRAAGLALLAVSSMVLANERVITLAPHITELVYAAGAGESIVATVDSSDYPPAALGLPRVGDGLNVNVERALALRPSMVIAWQPSGGAITLAPTLAALHIPLLYSEPRALDDIPAEVRRMGELLGTPEVAQAAAQALDMRIAALRQRYAGRSPVRLFLELGPEPIYTIGSDPLLNDVLQTCGAENLYAKSRVAAPQVSTESLLVQQPDVVIVSTVDPARLEARTRAWSALGLRAAREQRIHGIDPDQLFRPGPRLIDAAETLCSLIDMARSPPPGGLK